MARVNKMKSTLMQIKCAGTTDTANEWKVQTKHGTKGVVSTIFPAVAYKMIFCQHSVTGGVVGRIKRKNVRKKKGRNRARKPMRGRTAHSAYVGCAFYIFSSS